MGTAGISLPFAAFILCFCAALINLGSFITFAWRKKKCCLPEMFSWFSSWWYCIWISNVQNVHQSTFSDEQALFHNNSASLKTKWCVWKRPSSREMFCQLLFPRVRYDLLSSFFSQVNTDKRFFAQEEVSGLQVESILSTLESLAFISDNNWLC